VTISLYYSKMFLLKTFVILTLSLVLTEAAPQLNPNTFEGRQGTGHNQERQSLQGIQEGSRQERQAVEERSLGLILAGVGGAMRGVQRYVMNGPMYGPSYPMGMGGMVSVFYILSKLLTFKSSIPDLVMDQDMDKEFKWVIQWTCRWDFDDEIK